jgi:hypothetical protein
LPALHLELFEQPPSHFSNGLLEGQGAHEGTAFHRPVQRE